MTPTSTDRAHSISPLDIFGAISHLSTAGNEPSHAFETLLNKPNAKKIELSWHPQQHTPAEQTDREADIQREYTPKVVRAAEKKPPAKDCPTEGRQRIDDEQQTEDEVAADPANGSTASTAQPPPPQEDAKVAHSAGEDVRTRPEDPASDEKLIDTGDAAHVPVTIESQISGLATQSSESNDSSQPDPHAVTVAADVNTAGQVKPDLPIAEPVAADDQVLSPGEYATAVHGNGPLSLADSGLTSNTATDPIVAIDGQSAAQNIQPSEPSNNTGEEGQSTNDEPGSKQDATDAQAPILPESDTLTNPSAQNSAAPPPAASTDTPPPSKDAPQQPSSSSQTTVGIQPNPTRLPQHVLTRAEGHHGHNPVPVPIDSARFLSRVAKAFTAAQQRDGEVRLRLSPPELGSLRLQVSVQDGVMVARVETETEAAKAQLTNNLPALRERLAEQGIRVERFDIDLMQHTSSGTPDRPSDPQQQPEPQPLRSLRMNQSTSDTSSPAASTGNWNGQGRLNVII